jgi:hypothetical protein
MLEVFLGKCLKGYVGYAGTDADESQELDLDSNFYITVAEAPATRLLGMQDVWLFYVGKACCKTSWGQIKC